MNNIHKMKTHFLLALLICGYGMAFGQGISYKIAEDSKMTIDGTSTIHSWTSKVNTINGSLMLDDKVAKKDNFKKGDKVQQVNISIPVTSIESPRGAAMDQKTYNALKSEEHPNITFELGDNKITSVSGDTFEMEAKGNLKIAGKSQAIVLQVKGARNSASKVSFVGSYTLNMKDYDIEPPSAMFGQIVTGEEVTINFDLIVSK
ncbi:MAG: YceI family protein [Cyclobacteriaceae bacterium]